MKKYILIFVISLVAYTQAQVTQQWAARYNGTANNHDYAQSVAVDNSGNVYTTGYSTGPGSGFDYLTTKCNSSGVQQWASRYNGPGNGTDYSYSIAVDVSGNVYITGGSIGNGTDYDYATVKYDASGVQQWVQRYHGAGGQDFGRSIAVDASGNVYVTGGSSESGSFVDYTTIKYDPAGAVLWLRSYNGPANSTDEAYSLVIDGSGNVYVTGESIGNGTENDYATVKYNSAGVQQWASRYNGAGNLSDNAKRVVVDASGNVYVTGGSNGSTSLDYATIKYNSAGVQQWAAVYSGPGTSDVASSIAVSPTGNVYVTGKSYLIGQNFDYATIKYNSAGVQQWAERYAFGPGSDDQAYAIALDNFENVYVTGYSDGTYYNDFTTIKYTTGGAQQWLARYNGPGNNTDQAFAIFLDNQNNVYVTGASIGSGNYDFATIKYSQTVGIKPISNEIPEKFVLSQNYPNPFNPATNINFSIPKSGMVKLVVYDLLGKPVSELVNGNYTAGTYKVEFNAAVLSSGVYFYKLETEGFTNIKKMMLVK